MRASVKRDCIQALLSGLCGLQRALRHDERAMLPHEERWFRRANAMLADLRRI
jgi:hypothetical protein